LVEGVECQRLTSALLMAGESRVISSQLVRCSRITEPSTFVDTSELTETCLSLKDMCLMKRSCRMPVGVIISSFLFIFRLVVRIQRPGWQTDLRTLRVYRLDTVSLKFSNLMIVFSLSEHTASTLFDKKVYALQKPRVATCNDIWRSWFHPTSDWEQNVRL